MTEAQYNAAIAIYHPTGGKKVGKIYDIRDTDNTAPNDLVVTGGGGTRINKSGLVESTVLDEPKIDYSFGNVPAFLIEPVRTNFLKYSNDLTNEAWTKQSTTTVTANFATAPDGTNTASKVTADGFSGFYYLRATITGIVSRSVWLKSVDGTPVTVVLKDPTTTVTELQCSVTSVWKRFVLVESNGASSSGIWIDNINATGVLVWGAQLEQTDLSSYIPTTTVAVTRTASAVSIATPSGVTQIEEKVNGVVNTITTIPTTYSMKEGSTEYVIFR